MRRRVGTWHLGDLSALANLARLVQPVQPGLDLTISAGDLLVLWRDGLAIFILNSVI